MEWSLFTPYQLGGRVEERKKKKKEWRERADKNGYLNWEGFSSGLAKALERDASRLKKTFQDRSKQTEAEKRLNYLKGRKGRGFGTSLLLNPVEGSEIEMFLASCDGRSLVQALARTKKEVYRTQMNLQQMSAIPTSKEASSVSGSGETKSEIPRPPLSVPTMGNEREELLKGAEILERTREWFSDRLEQLALERPSTKKISAEELLAIMEGTSTPSTSTSSSSSHGSTEKESSYHHVHQINTHLAALAKIAPTMGGQNRATKESARATKERDKRRKSDSDTLIKGQKGHRRVHTSPIGYTTTSGAHVVGIDIPSSPVDHTPSPSDHAHRSSSMRDVREPLHNQKARRGLVYLANEGVVGPEVQVKKHKPRRSHSLNYHSDGRGSGHGSDMDIAGGSNYSPSSPNPAPQYPLRETVSLSQLPGGYAGGSRRIPHGGAAPLIDPHGGSGLDHTSLSKSTSLRSLPSGNTSRHHQFNSDSIHHQFHSHSTSRQGPDRGPSSYGSSRDIKKEQLRAKQVAAHKHVLMTEIYQSQDRNQSVV